MCKVREFHTLELTLETHLLERDEETLLNSREIEKYIRLKALYPLILEAIAQFYRTNTRPVCAMQVFGRVPSLFRSQQLITAYLPCEIWLLMRRDNLSARQHLW